MCFSKLHVPVAAFELPIAAFHFHMYPLFSFSPHPTKLPGAGAAAGPPSVI